MSLLFYGNVTYKIAYHLLINGEGYFDASISDKKKKSIVMIVSILASITTMATLVVIS